MSSNKAPIWEQRESATGCRDFYPKMLALSYISSDLWYEKRHPFCYRVQRCTKKICGCIIQVTHAAWYLFVYLYYLILFALLFWGPGYSSDRDSFSGADLHGGDETGRHP